MRISALPTYSLHNNTRLLWLFFVAVLLSASVSLLLTFAVAHSTAILASLNAVDIQAMELLNFDGSTVADRLFYHTSKLNIWLPLSVVAVVYTIGWHKGT